MEVITSKLAFEPLAKAISEQPHVQSTDYVEQAMKVFETFQIDGVFEDAGVRKNVEIWAQNKSKLMDLFRKHPLWNEEAKAIVFKNDEIRKVNFSEAVCNLRRVREYVRGNIAVRSDYAEIIRSMVVAFNHNRTATITDEFIKYFKEELYDVVDIPKHINSFLRTGVRFTKFVNKVFSEVVDENGNIVDATKLEDPHGDGDRTFDSYQKRFAKFADNLSELKIKKITVMSLNFNDFMTMSNGNSWSSCHFINSHGIFHDDAETSYHGMYKQGCLSYALDDVSFVFYTLPAEYTESDYYMQQKLNRMCCQYQDGVLITGKCYPDNNDEKITTYRQTMQFVLSQCEGFDNSWTFSRNIDRVQMFVTTAYGASQYPDYEYEGQMPTVSIRKGATFDLDKQIEVGHESYCLCCGATLDNDDHSWLQCRSHRRNKFCKCGQLLTDENSVHIGEDWYCRDCVFYCHDCGQLEVKSVSGYHTIELNGETIELCTWAFNRYAQCEKCGKWFLRKNGKTICNECAFEEFNERLSSISSKLKLKKKESYESDEYVLIQSKIELENDKHDVYVNNNMCDEYAERIVKITRLLSDGRYRISSLDGEHWRWSADTFVCAIENGEEWMIGKKLEEVM